MYSHVLDTEQTLFLSPVMLLDLGALYFYSTWRNLISILSVEKQRHRKYDLSRSPSFQAGAQCIVVSLGWLTTVLCVPVQTVPLTFFLAPPELLSFPPPHPS